MLKTMTVRATIAAFLAGLSMSAHAVADTARPLNVPAGELVAALESLAKQADIQLIYQPEQLRGIHTRGVSGTYEPEEAVSLLLEGTQLTIRTDSETGVMLVAPATAPKESPPLSVAPRKFFWSRFHLAQTDAPLTSQGDPSLSTEEAPREDKKEEAQPQKKVAVDEIIVTGTRIRGAEASASPVYTFDREDFAESGATTVQGLMRTLPQSFTGGPTETGSILASSRNDGAGNGGFGAGINLRGLGAASTLVLLNGRRMAPVGHGGFVDVSTIPLSALERIDVLPDGASAIYGSDAVGGVVNFVLREDYEGFETSAGYGAVTDGGLRELTASQLVGANWGSGSVLFDADYARRDPLLASDRPYASALANGVTFLTPDEERISALIRARQELNDRLSLRATAYATDRDAGNNTYVPFQARQFVGNGATDQVGGTFELNWKASDTWTVNLAQTFTRMKVVRDGELVATDTLPASPSYVASDQRMSASELEAEGVLFHASGGAARLAMGAEYRTEDVEEVREPGPLSARSVSDFDRTVSSAYAEVFVPLVGAENQLGMVRRLDVTAAVRYEDYDDVGSADTWKFGVLWSPVDGLNLRATRGTSFRAPYLYQFQDALGFAYLLDTPNPAAPGGSTLLALISQVPALDLGPENATIWTAGFDVGPALLAGFRAQATYFDIDYEDRIVAARLTPTPFADPTLAGLIATPADPGIISQIEALPPSQVYRLGGVTAPLSAAEATFDGRTRNQARTEVSGIDLLLERAFSTGIGDFNLGVNASYLLSFKTQQNDTSPAREVVNTIFNPVRLRTRAFASYNRSGWQLSAAFNYTDDYTDNQVPPFVAVSSWSTVDLTVAYEFSATNWLEGVTLRANALNVFDKDPPRIIDREPAWGNPGFDTENANPLGRLLSLHIVKAW
jgi:outer membrane receptor protein involved in Fe transport